MSRGYGGGNVPTADETNFFTATDDDLIELGKRQLRKERKLRHVGLKVLLAFMIILVLVLGTAVYAYWQGYGYPTQQAVITDFFTAHARGDDVLQYWIGAEGNEKTIEKKLDMIAKTEEIEIVYLDATMSRSEAVVIAHLKEGGTLRYEIQLDRSFLGWMIQDITLVFSSRQ